MAPLATPNNLHPFTSANGFKVWHQELLITKRARGDMPVTFRLTSGCYCLTVVSTSTCIMDNSFTTPFSHIKSSGHHRDLTIKESERSLDISLFLRGHLLQYSSETC